MMKAAAQAAAAGAWSRKPYPGGHGHSAQSEVVVPLRYRPGQGELSFISMTAVVGTPLDITVEELAIESFYPADEPTAAALRL